MRRQAKNHNTSIDFSKSKSLTEQQHKDEVKTQNILKKYAVSGVLPRAATQPQFMNIPDAPDFHESMNLITAVEQDFAQLPATLRAEFENNPAKFFDFCMNEDNRDALIEKGISTAHFTPIEPPATPVDVRVIQEVPTTE